jgi:hypothetical protein
MLINSTASLHKAGPPSLKPQAKPEQSGPIDTLAAQDNRSDRSLKATLTALASLAVVLGPQAAQAAEAVEAPVEQVQDDSLIDRVESRADSFRDKADNLKDRIDPHGYLDEWSTKVGDYDLSINPIDLDLKPRWKDGGPQLKFKGDILETRLSKSRELDGGWTMTQGANAKITGEVTTYDDPELDFQTGLFRDYRGPVGDSFQARLRSEVGIRHRFVGEDEGLRAGVSFRQELEGGEYQFMGHDYSLYAEGRQSAYRNIDTGQNDFSYKFMVGPKKDFDLRLFGQDTTLSVTFGPEIKGSNHGKSFDVGVGSKVRLRLKR